MSVIYKIHPAMGFARVGDSEEFYIEPVTAGGLPVLTSGKKFTRGDFRSADGKMRRQAAAFGVYRYDGDDGREVRPGRDGVKSIEWTVRLANKKAAWYKFRTSLGENGYAPDHPLRNAGVEDLRGRQELMIDPGPRTLDGPDQRVCFSRTDNPGDYPMTFPPEDLEPDPIDTLGELRTTGDGSLLVLGGYGHSGSTDRPPMISDYANNDNWWDDLSDGPVTARLVLEDGRRIEVDVPSWVSVVVPAYAPQIQNLVTLYDTIYDAMVRNCGYRPRIFRDSFWNRDYHPDYETEIEPILKRIEKYPWVVAIPPHAHEFDLGKLGDPDPQFNGLRRFYLSVTRPSSSPNDFASTTNGYPMMPYLAGDNALNPHYLSSTYLTVTDTQYFLLMQWTEGMFKHDSERPPEPPGEALDRAALENCVGGAFSPGIEMTWISRNPLIYSEPFRIKHRPDIGAPLRLGEIFAEGLEAGDVTQYMALPWQADFNECSSQPITERQPGGGQTKRWLWWWPPQRPLFVYTSQDHARRQVAWVGSTKDQNAKDYLMFPDDLLMIEHWQQLGFVFNVNEHTGKKPFYMEVERTLPRLPDNAGGSEDS